LIPCEQSAKDNIHNYVPPAVGGQLEAELLPPGNTDFADVKPGFTVPSLRFVQALFDIYLRSGAPFCCVTGCAQVSCPGRTAPYK